jgi:exo-1,4-beta-D-glucosaminidase
MDGVVGGEGNTLMSYIRTLALGLGAVSIAAVHGDTLYAAARAAEPSPRVVELKEGWQVQSGCGLNADGESISKPQFKSADWLPASVPSTVLAVQLAAGKIPDPYYGDNLRKLPGVDYPIGENFSNLPMSQDSPYHCAWWYRKQFNIPVANRGRILWLHFGGINYRANIWLNGKRIADSTQVAGAYRTYDLNISVEARPGKSNVLAVETFAPTPQDLGINWVDWNPSPPDKDMGLWGPITLTTTGAVTVRSPMVSTHLTDAAGNQADLTVVVELHNAADHPVHGTALSTVGRIQLRQQVDLKAGEDKTVTFDTDDYPALRVHHPELWWPYQMGTPHLENLSVSFEQDGEISDTQSVQFGIREITSELTDKGARLFRINGKPLLVRGAGWSQDMLLRENPERLDEEFRFVKDMHLNTIRLEGKMESEHFFHLADEQGILVMLGWCCCDQWEHWDKWTPETLNIATASLNSQLLRVRNHASAMVWLNGSDGPPPANVEQAYLKVEADTHWPNPILSSASQAPTTVTGKSGVKMTGPYDYVAPSYWLADIGKYGGAYGFNTETGPGPAIPKISSLNRFLPAANIWPPDEVWSLHYGGEGFKQLNVFNTAMDAIYGPAKDVVDYTRVAQTMAYDGERAMFEAYGRNKYTSTGVIQWMLNNAWPSMIWHLYDYYLDTGGGYFGAKKACEPLHIQYSFDDHSIFVVNSRYQAAQQLTASASVFDHALIELYTNSSVLDAGPDASVHAFTIPEGTFSSDSQLYFVQLTLKNQNGETVSRNFYWVPAKLTEFDWSKTDYTHTPALQHEDLKILRNLPDSRVSARADVVAKNIHIQLHNPSKTLAFQVAVNAIGADGRDITPVLWSDNYIELMPGETCDLSATLPAKVTADRASVVVSGWNIPSQSVHLGSRPANRAALSTGGRVKVN